ncbi:hypothetical protein LOTGIDRAFT_122770, partial [Lottia gigantea]
IFSAEPLKKKRKSDPGSAKRKSDKLKKKFDKELRRIDKRGNPLKPIDEFEEWRRMSKMQSTRKRGRSELSQEDFEERVVIMKTWGRFKTHQNGKDSKVLHKLLLSQEKALEELRNESEELYQKAIEVDENLCGLVLKGPYQTPPIPDYISPDGEYVDITRTDFDSPWTDPTKQQIITNAKQN